MDLMDAIKEQIIDEEKAYVMYSGMASEADDAGMHQTARNLRSIAADEDRHHTILQQMYLHPELGPVVVKPIAARNPFSWKIYNPAVGEIYESSERYSLPSNAVLSARNYISERFKYGDIAPSAKGYQIKILDNKGEAVPDYEQWYMPPESRTWPEELAWREKSGFGKLHRPFPETDADWMTLAQDIKANSVEAGWDIVNFYLNIVLGNDPGDVDDAKRWLVNKAGELGIT